MTRCDFRTHRECRCPSGQCQQQPAHTPAHTKTKPPLYGPSMRDTCAVAAVLVSLLMGGALMAKGHLDRKEQTRLAKIEIMRASK